jgi:hypothetical protein
MLVKFVNTFVPLLGKMTDGTPEAGLLRRATWVEGEIGDESHDKHDSYGSGNRQ